MPSDKHYSVNVWEKKKKHLTAVTSLMAHSCSSLTFSTKNGVIPIEETWKRKQKKQHKSSSGLGCSFWHDKLESSIILQVLLVFTWRMVVSVSSWISRSSEMLLTMSHTLLYNMIITRCLCVEHFARFALELNMPPRWTRIPLLNPRYKELIMYKNVTY